MNFAALLALCLQLNGDQRARKLSSTISLFEVADRHWSRFNKAAGKIHGDPSSDFALAQYKYEFGQLLATLELLALAINNAMIDSTVSDFYRTYLRDVLKSLTDRGEDCQFASNMVGNEDTFSEIRQFVQSEPSYLEYKNRALMVFSGAFEIQPVGHDVVERSQGTTSVEHD